MLIDHHFLVVLSEYLVWVGCSWGILGLLWAFFEAKQAEGTNRSRIGYWLVFSCIFSVFGPIGLAFVFCLTGFGKHGWRLPR
jgi:hypothetical protein